MEKSCSTAGEKTCKERLKDTFSLRNMLSAGIGGALGFAYYYFVGCSSGSCAITSNPYISILFGATMGLLLFRKGGCGCAG